LKKTNSELYKKTSRGSIVLAINIGTFAFFFLRDIFSSRFFGISNRMDAVYLGIMIPSLATNFLFQPLSDLLIPKYQARLINNKNILHLYMNVMCYVVIISLVISFAFLLLLSPISALLASGFDLEKQVMVGKYISRSIPIIFFGGMIISTNIFLNSIGQYVFTASAALFVPIISILFVKFFGQTSGEISFINGMIIGQVLNFLAVFLLLILKSKKRFSHREFKITKITKAQMLQYGSQNLVNLCFYGFNAISASFGTHFQEGTTTLIVLVNKLIGFFTNLFNNTFSSVLMPYFSRLFLKDKTRFHKENKVFLYLLTLGGAIVILAIYFSSNFISHIFFSSSKITAAQAVDFVKYLKIGIFQVPFLITMVICFKWLTIYSEFKILSIFSIVALAMDLALNLILKSYFGNISILLAPYLALFVIMIITLGIMCKKDIGIDKKDFVILSAVWTTMTVFLLGLI
jgi:peptidoglycan biosynthesis protein MviN/MurJ (putative lipid II flippase)